jgi:hypothetical protein
MRAQASNFMGRHAKAVRGCANSYWKPPMPLHERIPILARSIDDWPNDAARRKRSSPSRIRSWSSLSISYSVMSPTRSWERTSSTSMSATLCNTASFGVSSAWAIRWRFNPAHLPLRLFRRAHHAPRRTTAG